MLEMEAEMRVLGVVPLPSPMETLDKLLGLADEANTI
jgi:hypothetical protein